MKYLSILLILLSLYSCRQKADSNTISISCYKLAPLTVKKHPIRSGEWRASYAEAHEPLETYLSRNPTSASAKRCRLYVVQLGQFDLKGKEILEDTKLYLHAFFQIEVRALPSINLKVIAKKYSRNNEFGRQLQTGIILDSLLTALLPDSAFALIAFTTNDLYPSNAWNYVFGQASLERRVGVWSLARLGDYNKDDEAFSLCLKRTLHIASHETGHLFGIHHCVAHECCMNGSISLEEGDRQPSWFCWECLAKICCNRKIQPAQPLSALLAFHKTITHDTLQQRYYTQALKLLE